MVLRLSIRMKGSRLAESRQEARLPVDVELGTNATSQNACTWMVVLHELGITCRVNDCSKLNFQW